MKIRTCLKLRPKIQKTRQITKIIPFVRFLRKLLILEPS